MLTNYIPVEPPTHWWQGASGRWYCFAIYPLSSIPSWIGECNYIFARPRYDQNRSREPFYIGEKGDTNRFSDHEKLNPALRHGATELHVHFLATCRQERLDIETDLRHGHQTPLNEQPTTAPATGVNTLVGALSGRGIASGVHSGGGILGALNRHGVPASEILPYSYPFEQNSLLDFLDPNTGFMAFARALNTKL